MEDAKVSRPSKSDFGEADSSSQRQQRQQCVIDDVKHESKHRTESSQGNISGEQLNSEVELNVAPHQRLITHNEEVEELPQACAPFNQTGKQKKKNIDRERTKCVSVLHLMTRSLLVS